VGPAISMINLHVLLVDDDASFLDLLEALLKNFGITHIVRASSGQDAYKILSEPDCSITCVLCDISMARGTGLELLQIVRSGKGHLARPDVTFILITAIEDDELRTTARQLGANGFLLKPVTEERLREAMQPRRLRDVFQPIRRMLER
jgi:CheY-like chemotaxis protein